MPPTAKKTTPLPTARGNVSAMLRPSVSQVKKAETLATMTTIRKGSGELLHLEQSFMAWHSLVSAARQRSRRRPSIRPACPMGVH